MKGAGYAILAVAFIIRAASAYLYPLSNRLFSDMGNYSNIAEDLLTGTWLPTHFFQPIGFPFVVAFFKLAFRNWTQALAVYQSIIGAASLWFMWKAAEKSFGPRVGFAALVVGASHVQWLGFNLFAISENTFAFLLSLLLWVSLKVVERPSYAWSAAWGVVFIAAMWIKSTHVFSGTAVRARHPPLEAPAVVRRAQSDCADRRRDLRRTGSSWNARLPDHRHLSAHRLRWRTQLHRREMSLEGQ